MALMVWAGASSAFAGEITGVEFKADSSSVEIRGSGLAGFQTEDKPNPPQLVLTFNGTTISGGVPEKTDTSKLSGSVLQVSAYPVPGNSPQARVVVDFNQAIPYQVKETQDGISVQFDTSNVSTAAGAPSVPVVKTDDPLKTIMDAERDKKFTGSPITLKLKDADVHEVLRLISEASGFNIVIHPNVTGKLTLSLDHVPWDQALEVVLTTLKLSAERNQSVLRVMPRDLFMAEKQSLLESEKLSKVAAPRITRIFPISYSDLGQLSTLLQNFANSQNLSPGNSGIPTTILVDNTTQSLVVRDTAESLERIGKMITLLDVQAPQILIEGKVVEATDQFTKSIGGSFGIGGTQHGFAFNGPASLVGAPAVTYPLGSQGAGIFSGADVTSIANRVVSINATLNMAEKDSLIKVVASPRNVVLSGQSATINQTTSATIPIVTQNGTSTITTYQQVNANTTLTVKPRVTNDGSVLVQLDLHRDVLDLSNPAAPVSEPRSMNTVVVVESGNTLVIGGILSNEIDHSESGMPFLRNLPIIGWLFGSVTNETTKSELMFFVTPRILNPRKTGLITEDTRAMPKI